MTFHLFPKTDSSLPGETPFLRIGHYCLCLQFLPTYALLTGGFSPTAELVSSRKPSLTQQKLSQLTQFSSKVE